MMGGYGGGWRRYGRVDEDAARPAITRSILARVFAYGRPYWRYILFVLVAIAIVSLIELLPPLLYRDLIDNVLPNRDVARLNLLAVGMLGIPLLSGLIKVASRYFSARAGEGIIYDLRQQMYVHLQRMSLRFFTHTKQGEIITRFNSDVVGAQNAITGTIPTLVTNVLTLATTLAVMMTIEWRLGLLALSVLPLFLLPARRIGRILRDIRRESMDYNAAMSNVVSQTLNINGALLVKTFGSQAREAKSFGDANQNVREIGVRSARVGQLFYLGLSAAGTVGAGLIYWVGGYMVLNDTITTGTIVAFVAYLARLYGPLTSLSSLHADFIQSLVSFERVFEYLDKEVEIQDKPNAVKLTDVQGQIRFDHVWFRYQSTATDADLTADLESEAERAATVTELDEQEKAKLETTLHVPIPTRHWALQDVSFTVEPGELVALVGPSGSGKTTTTYLLPRLYDPTEGAIYLDGVDLRDATQASVAEQIGMVTQETYLFHDTIWANLIYAKPDATQAEVEAAARAANIHEMILRLPNGYETLVGERGYRLSGGEKQRLAIARVILKDPRILVLDEATSHLDSQNEAMIQAALVPLFAGRTSIVIAHRLSTVLAADQILVLAEGQIVEQGTHAELMAMGGLYTELYRTQFTNNTPEDAEVEVEENLATTVVTTAMPL
jgi:ATP-binding cassette, subfamily B, bacterial